MDDGPRPRKANSREKILEICVANMRARDHDNYHSYGTCNHGGEGGGRWLTNGNVGMGSGQPESVSSGVKKVLQKEITSLSKY